MGCTPSKKHQHKSNGTSESRIPYIEDDDGLEVYTVDIYDQKVIAQLKKDFRENLDMFLLNNILMSVMFFENYDLEMKKARNTISIEDQEMSRKLITDHNKRFIMPDTAVEMVNHRVSYQRRHGKMKSVQESIALQRMYVVYDTIDILKEDEDLDHYSNIDKPTDRAHVKNSKHNGYVKLRHPEFHTTPSGSNYAPSSVSTHLSNARDVLTPPLDLSEPASSYLHLNSPDEYDEYSQINEMKTLQPLSQTRSSSNSSGAPINCLRPIKSKNLHHVDDTDDLYIIHKYYDSTEFMKHFTNQVFPGELAESLGFDRNAILDATHNSRAIYCNTEQDRGGSIKCEIVPAVLNPWPGLNAWAARDRPIVMDKRNMIVYRWPTPVMVQDMQKFSAVLVPRGFMPKRGQNPDYNLEWEVSFPKAEKYMHTRMSHAQMKCYLFMAILHKTFIEPATAQRGLLFDHIRTLIYWKCEENYKDWPENRLGEKMILLLKDLKIAMGRRALKDYFIERKIHNICERPIGHFITALRNVTFTARKFYPMLNFDKLYEILNAQESIALIVNPAIINAHNINRTGRTPVTYNEEQKWLQKKMQQSRNQRYRTQWDVQENLTEEPRASVDSIDLKWTANKNTKIDSTKAGEFMKFFADHFVKIAEKSMKYHGAMTQALFYLKQAWYLTKVMEDPIVGSEMYARDLQTKIHELEVLCKESTTEECFTPTTPARNSITQIQHQVVKGVTVDLNNVTQNFVKGYHQNSQHNDVKRKTKFRINSVVE
ncbi:cell fate determining protein mab21-related [Holotrichia oblita]|uniref:Cell fate determining protein mab21-related n=1 Tax=Holotrichia oblita TaxID=644536 RepID=A0ACB9T3V0_HOLOL|nr:cell fate determining protein mab21-related [Holotrichia oblita]